MINDDYRDTATCLRDRTSPEQMEALAGEEDGTTAAGPDHSRAGAAYAFWRWTCQSGGGWFVRFDCPYVGQVSVQPTLNGGRHIARSE